jgi:putative CocE/NonD family hydrolase
MLKAHPVRSLLTALAIAATTLSAPAVAEGPAPTSDAVASVPTPYDVGEPRYADLARRSFHIPMRDGVRIAVDLWLPEGLAEGTALPTIVHQTRYWRSAELVWPASVFFDAPPDPIAALVRHGYAWVSVDARGSGASFGTRPYPWSPDEVRDGSEVVDWIVSQPWSNGNVGTFGTSYDGTTAEFLVTTRHPAVLAAAPRFSLFDVYADISHPGGLHMNWFTENWRDFNGSIDHNDVPDHMKELMGWRARLVRGVRPVDGPEGDALLEAAVKDHAANWDVHEDALKITYRDDGNQAGESSDIFSPFSYAEQVDASKAAVWSWSGWYDGGYAHAAIKRHLTLTGSKNRLILGPWDHGGGHQVIGARSVATDFDNLGQLLKFFDHHLAGADTGLLEDKPVHYYTQVEGRWKEADAWPPAADPMRLYLGPRGTLGPDAPTGSADADRYNVDPSHGTGDRARWNSLMGLPVFYDDRAVEDAKLLVYESPALDRDLEVTGHPVMTLYAASSADDGAFFAYLEDVAPDGSVTYVTEGVLRALHRKLATTPPPYRQAVPYRTFLRADARPLRPGQVAELVIDLLPTSYLFREGHKIRVAFAGADVDHFAQVPEGDPPTWEVQRNRAHPSHILLPVVD